MEPIRQSRAVASLQLARRYAGLREERGGLDGEGESECALKSTSNITNNLKYIDFAHLFFTFCVYFSPPRGAGPDFNFISANRRLC